MNKKIKLLGIYPIITTFIILGIFYLITGIDTTDLLFLFSMCFFFFICAILIFSIYYRFIINKEKKEPVWKISIALIITIILIILCYAEIHETLMWKLTPEQDRFLGTWEEPTSGAEWTFKKNGSLVIENDYSEFKNSDVINFPIQDTKINRNYSLKDGHIFIDNQRYEYKFENLGEDLYIYYENDDLFVWLYKDK